MGSTFITQEGLQDYNGVQLQLAEAGPTQSSLLLQRKHKALEVQQELDEKKAEIDARMALCAQKEAELAARREKMKERMEQFQRYIEENDLKRQRALRREKEETGIRKQKEAELEAYQAEMREVDEQRNRLRHMAARLRVYDEHLFAVSASAPDSYPEIADVMKRYETLVSANNDLRALVENSHREIDELRTAQRELDKVRQDALLVVTSTAAARQTRLEEINAEIARLDAASHLIAGQQVEKIRTVGQVKGAIANLLRRLDPMHQKVEGRDIYDMNKVLSHIKTRAGDLRDISKMKPDAWIAAHQGQTLHRNVARTG